MRENGYKIARLPVSSWAFACRVWLAVVLALFVGFWLELASPSTQALTAAILAEKNRGQALEKAGFRFVGTATGVVTSIGLVGLLSQTGAVLLVAFSAWLGLCVWAASLLDGNRAYAAVLSGYTVAFIAAQQIDNPQHVFESSMARGAAIVVGIVSTALVSSLLFAPDHHSRFSARLIRHQVNSLLAATRRREAKRGSAGSRSGQGMS